MIPKVRYVGIKDSSSLIKWMKVKRLGCQQRIFVYANTTRFGPTADEDSIGELTSKAIDYGIGISGQVNSKAKLYHYSNPSSMVQLDFRGCHLGRLIGTLFCSSLVIFCFEDMAFLKIGRNVMSRN